MDTLTRFRTRVLRACVCRARACCKWFVVGLAFGEKPGGVARHFSPSQLPVQTLTRCPYSPSVQSHGSTCVHTLKMPNTGIVWTHTQYWTHYSEWVALLLRLPCLTLARQPECSYKGQWSTKQREREREETGGTCCVATHLMSKHKKFKLNTFC